MVDEFIRTLFLLRKQNSIILFLYNTELDEEENVND